jgi:hypothetical protein
MKANGDMKDYSCCNMSVREDLSRRDLRLTVAVRCVHWTDLRGLCLDPAAHQSRRHSREVQLDWKRLQGLPGKADAMNYAPQWQQQQPQYHDHH